MFKAIFFHAPTSFYVNYNFTRYDFLYHTAKALKWQDFHARLWHIIFPAWRGTTGGGKLMLPTPNFLLGWERKRELQKRRGVSQSSRFRKQDRTNTTVNSWKSCPRFAPPDAGIFWEWTGQTGTEGMAWRKGAAQLKAPAGLGEFFFPSRYFFDRFEVGICTDWW